MFASISRERLEPTIIIEKLIRKPQSLLCVPIRCSGGMSTADKQPDELVAVGRR
jgi:hypothetical protein